MCIRDSYTAIREIERTNACEIAGRMGDRLCDGLKGLLAQYGLPFVAYNQGSIVHLAVSYTHLPPRGSPRRRPLFHHRVILVIQFITVLYL